MFDVSPENVNATSEKDASSVTLFGRTPQKKASNQGQRKRQPLSTSSLLHYYTFYSTCLELEDSFAIPRTFIDFRNAITFNQSRSTLRIVPHRVLVKQPQQPMVHQESLHMIKKHNIFILLGLIASNLGISFYILYDWETSFVHDDTF